MRAFLCGLTVAGVAFAQGFGAFEKAPPEVDDALRARIAIFYQAHVDGKFRLADQVVAEDSKDTFFGAQKTQYKDHRLVSIAYKENFTKAQVVVAVGDYFVFPGVGRTEMSRPESSSWKLENGQWWWYIPRCDPEKGVDTPWGKMSCTAATSKTLAEMEQELKGRKGLLLNSVKVDRTSVSLSVVAPSSEAVTLTNTFDGTLSLELQPVDMPGLSVRLDKKELKAGETGKLLIAYKPDVAVAKPALTARINVVPTAQVIEIPIQFAKPADAPK